MEQKAKVCQTYPDGTAQVTVIRQSACSGDCHQCAGCGAQQESLRFTVRNPIGARAGELVTVRSESGPVLAAAAVVYLVPMVLFFLGYALGAALWQQGALAGCLTFLLGLALAVAYDRRAAGRKVEYTITGYPKDSHTKGDNDLD